MDSVKNTNSYIIETCHEAAFCASYSRRTKIKVDDFKFTLRKDPQKLGRVTELLNLDRDIKSKRKAFDYDEGQLGKAEDRPGAGAGAGASGAGATGIKSEGGVGDGRPDGEEGRKRRRTRGGKASVGVGRGV